MHTNTVDVESDETGLGFEDNSNNTADENTTVRTQADMESSACCHPGHHGCSAAVHLDHPRPEQRRDRSWRKPTMWRSRTTFPRESSSPAHRW